jgi:hypothetical protein
VTLLSPAGRSNEHHGGDCVLLVYGTMARRCATVYTPDARTVMKDWWEKVEKSFDVKGPWAHDPARIFVSHHRGRISFLSAQTLTLTTPDSQRQSIVHPSAFEESNHDRIRYRTHDCVRIHGTCLLNDQGAARVVTPPRISGSIEQQGSINIERNGCLGKTEVCPMCTDDAVNMESKGPRDR